MKALSSASPLSRRTLGFVSATDLHVIDHGEYRRVVDGAAQSARAWPGSGFDVVGVEVGFVVRPEYGVGVRDGAHCIVISNKIQGQCDS